MQAGKDVKELIKYNTFLQLHKFRRIGNNVIWVSLTSLIFHRHCMFQHIVRLTIMLSTCHANRNLFTHAAIFWLSIEHCDWMKMLAASLWVGYYVERSCVLCYSFCLARLAWHMYERCWWQTKLIPNVPTWLEISNLKKSPYTIV
jgi:hypothetical protein